MRLLPALVAFLFASSAHAAAWNVDKEKSTLTFSGAQAGEAFVGQFSRFTADINFDPAAPEKGSINVEVDMASATIAADDEQNDALPTEDWFHTAQFPHATFTSTSIRATGPHAFVAQGNLTIRGVSKLAVLPFTLAPEGNATRATGTLGLIRTHYNLGGKQWADDRWIAYPVAVSYSILATQ